MALVKILRVKILLRDRSHVINNGGTTTKYLPLARCPHQCDPTYFSFVSALEVLSIFIKSKPEIVGMSILGYNYLCSAYADDTIFFLKGHDFYKAYG